MAQFNDLPDESLIKAVRRGQIYTGATLVSQMDLSDPCGLFTL
jgi:hypothetical protein